MIYCAATFMFGTAASRTGSARCASRQSQTFISTVLTHRDSHRRGHAIPPACHPWPTRRRPIPRRIVIMSPGLVCSIPGVSSTVSALASSSAMNTAVLPRPSLGSSTPSAGHSARCGGARTEQRTDATRRCVGMDGAEGRRAVASVRRSEPADPRPHDQTGAIFWPTLVAVRAMVRSVLDTARSSRSNSCQNVAAVHDAGADQPRRRGTPSPHAIAHGLTRRRTNVLDLPCAKLADPARAERPPSEETAAAIHAAPTERCRRKRRLTGAGMLRLYRDAAKDLNLLIHRMLLGIRFRARRAQPRPRGQIGPAPGRLLRHRPSDLATVSRTGTHLSGDTPG
jgi:hypothetical protein